METRKLEYSISSGDAEPQFSPHTGSADGARLKAMREVRKDSPDWQTGQGPTIVIRDALSKEVVEELRL